MATVVEFVVPSLAGSPFGGCSAAVPVEKTPNTKPQTPKKRQIPNPRSLRWHACVRIGFWALGVPWFLVSVFRGFVISTLNLQRRKYLLRGGARVWRRVNGTSDDEPVGAGGNGFPGGHCPLLIACWVARGANAGRHQ